MWQIAYVLTLVLPVSEALGPAALRGAPRNAASSSVTVTVNAAVTHQTMDGFGSSERVFDDPHVTNTFNPATQRSAVILTAAQQDEVLDRLYRDLRLKRVRPGNPDTEPGKGIEPVNDNADPNVMDPTKFDFGWKNLDAHCDYLVRARQRGATTFFPSPGNRETWMTTGEGAADAAEYSEWLLAQVRRCATLGVRLPFLSVANEPSYSRNTMSGEFIRDVIKTLGPRLRAEGFETLFVTPDDVRSSDAAAKTRTILSDPQARRYVGALATHLYDEPISAIGQMKTLAGQYGLPLWMTEFSVGALGSAGLPEDAFTWAELMHELLATYDVSAIDYLWGFFGQYDDAALISLNSVGSSYTGYTLRKEYYITGQYSRFLGPGARRVAADSTDSAVKVSAFRDGSSLVIVALNNTASETAVQFEIAGFPGIPLLQPTRTDKGVQNWASLTPIPVSGSRFAAVLPAGSLTTFVGNAAGVPPSACFADASTLCLNNNRFLVTASWRSASGAGSGRAVPLTGESGYFSFFDPGNVEMVVKALNGCGVNGRYWLFAAGLTNVEVILTVTDTRTGAMKTYVNPLDNSFSPIQDTSAFATCP